MKFLCDQMLARLGKWLRAAGYDARIIDEPLRDRQVLEIALAENRLLITRDRHFLHMKGAAPLLHYLKSNDLIACMEELMQQIAIDWLHAPFSRCLTCNTPLEIALNDSTEKIPQKIRQQKDTFWLCPQCKQFFWEGTHTARMRSQLKRWQEMAKKKREKTYD